MKNQIQEQQVIAMMRRSIPKKKVGIVKLRMIREGIALNAAGRFHDAAETAEMVRPVFEYADREMLVVMSLDSTLTPIAMEIVAVGGLCSSSLQASHEDSRPTAKIKEAGELLGIELIDHIILGLNNDYIRFKEKGNYPFPDGKRAA